MICFINSSPIAHDNRIQKYIEASKKNNVSFMAITWNRLMQDNKQSYEFQFSYSSPYGRKWKNIWGKILWQIYYMFILLSQRKKYEVIHAVDLDSIVGSLLIGRCLGKRVVFDMYDSYTIDLPNSFLGKTLKAIENKCCYICDLFILPDKERLQQLHLDKNKLKGFLEVENVPIYLTLEKKIVPYHDKIILSYVGNFDKNRGIEELLKFVSVNNERVQLEIAGVGILKPLVNEYAIKSLNINYHGTVNYDRALEIMKSSHIIVGMYHKTNQNHIYAAPNKYFEALFLSKPLLTTKGTLVGTKVEKNKMGYVIGELYEDLVVFFEEQFSAGFSNYEEICNNCFEIWENQYRNYYIDIYVNSYIGWIEKK